MTLDIIEVFTKKQKRQTNTIKTNNDTYKTLVEKYNIDVFNLPIVSNSEFKLQFKDKFIIVEKLLEAHELAKLNVQIGNITGRGFATNVCTYDNKWTIGTNFNNTRNDISSVCGERTAILTAYNNALLDFAKSNDINKKFDFKIKFLCMAQSTELQETRNSAVPCEDCLSWLNTKRYFTDNTVVLAFETNENDELFIKVTYLKELLPYRNMETSNKYEPKKPITYSTNAINTIEKENINELNIKNLIQKTYEEYSKNKEHTISNQKIACSVLTEDRIYAASKKDWTKRWFLEPLEVAVQNAINENDDKIKIKAICYFGDEYSGENKKYDDGVVSIKGLGRIRQKYATSETLLVLNFERNVIVTTVGEYLPQKFIQGYKIV